MNERQWELYRLSVWSSGQNRPTRGQYRPQLNTN